MLGEYLWTGFDYLGEQTPYGGRDNSTNGYWNDDWPARSSSFGAVDLCGFPKDRYFLYRSQWTSVETDPMVHLLPHWNWEGKEGQNIPVYVYTNAPEAELFLDGKSLGRKKKGSDLTTLKVAFNNWEEGEYPSPYRLSWDVPFAAGELRAVAYHEGESVAEKKHHTSGSPHRIQLIPDRTEIGDTGSDLSFVTITIHDKQGHFCPLANVQVDFAIEGPGDLIAVDNGNSASVESFQANTRKTFNGMALAIIRRQAGTQGAITLTASADSLEIGSVKIGHKAGPE